MEISADGTKVQAKPVELKTGTLKMNHPAWSTRLIGENGTIVVVAGRDGVAEVPVGRYALMGCQEYLRGGAGRGGSLRSHNSDAFDGKPKIVVIKPGEVTESNFGSPLTAPITVKQDGRKVTLTATVTGMDGAPLDFLHIGGQERPNAPTVTVTGPDGKTVFTQTMEFTNHVAYAATWDVPEGVQGDFTAELSNLDTSPCELKLTKATFSVK